MDYLIGAVVAGFVVLGLLGPFFVGEKSEISKRGAQPRTDPKPYPPKNAPLPYRPLPKQKPDENPFTMPQRFD